MYCQNCGSKQKEKAEFCTECGNPMKPQRGDQQGMATIIGVCMGVLIFAAIVGVVFKFVWNPFDTQARKTLADIEATDADTTKEGEETQEEVTEETEQKVEEETEEEEAYPGLSSFIICINSYSDAPSLSGDALEIYYKEQYDLWKSGEGYTEVFQDEEGRFHYEPAKEETTEKEEETKETNIQGEYMFPNSAVTAIAPEECVGLTAMECKIARNEIYARHGRMFTDATLQNYFNGCSWYTGTIAPEAFTNDILSEMELSNLKVISDYEVQMGYR